MPNLFSRQLKQMSKKTARSVAAEPIEILKKAKEQVSGQEVEIRETEKPKGSTEVESKKEPETKTMRDLRTIEALNREIEDIAKENLTNNLREKIVKGEEVFLDDYPQLSTEEKDFLKSMVNTEKAKRLQQEPSEEIASSSKKSRRLIHFGQKQAAQRQTTRVEKINPPSG